MEPQQVSNNQNNHLIKSIYVEDLFETYTYDLQTKISNDDSDKLLLLYGNNGAGKTTILNLIFHLLNPEPFGGHRSYVGKVPFTSIKIELNNGVTLTAYRQESPKPGEYNISLVNQIDSSSIDWAWIPEKNKRSIDNDGVYDIFCQKLKELNLVFHYLRDTRRVEGSQGSPKIHRKIVRSPYGHEIYYEEDELEEETLSPNKILIRSIGRATEWFRQQTLSGTNVGSSSVNSIYNELIRTIITKGESSQKADSSTISTLKNKLLNLKTRNKGFARFGLTAEIEISDIVKLLDSAQQSHANLLKTVLNPYLDGHNARLDALEEVQKVMDSFESLLSEFYSEKGVRIHLRDGLQVISNRGSEIPALVLSSGEKQLLLLLCHAISARKPGTIFVIDEPEISLNVKWQRQLIPALLTCLAGTDSQIILATHSIELLSRYKQHVTPLENIRGGEHK